MGFCGKLITANVEAIWPNMSMTPTVLFRCSTTADQELLDLEDPPLLDSSSDVDDLPLAFLNRRWDNRLIN